MMQSLVNDAAQSGWYPRWPAANDVTYVMGGDSPTALIASSYAFGAHNFDVETALKFMVKAGTEPGVGRHHNSERPYLADYLKLGCATHPTRKTVSPPRAPSSTPATTSPSPSLLAPWATIPNTSYFSSSPRTGKI